jgi:hypothetical protein
LAQSSGLEHRVIHQMEIIVPDKPSLPSRLVCEENGYDQSNRKQPLLRDKGRRRSRGRLAG